MLVGGSGLAAVAAVRGPSGPGLPLMARPAVVVLSVAAQGFRRRGGHENFHLPVLGGGSPPCLPPSERGWLMAQSWHYASPTIESGGTDRGWTENSGPVLVILLCFSEANVGSVAVIIQSFFSIWLLIGIFSGAYAAWNTFQGCHCNSSALKLKHFLLFCQITWI